MQPGHQNYHGLGHGQQSMVIEAIKQGAKDFVVKPFEKSRVLQAIKNVTEN